jgi:WXXGXW repeat (2 copies)
MINLKLTPTILLRTLFLVFLIGILSSRLYAQNDVLTNQSIIQLWKAGISKSVIGAKINSSQCNFDLSTNGLVDLKNNGVPDDIVTSMVNKGNSVAPAAPAPDQQQMAAPGDNAPQSSETAAQDDAAQQATQAPPELPAYEQPPCPTDGYLWQPGYWAFSLRNGFFWVPGVWVAPPNPGLLWTPAYWGYVGNVYVFHRGYWGASVGFYGGINYGFGYGGVGFVGGGWYGGHFRYNTAVVHVNETVIHNTYVDRTVIRNTPVTRTSFNGQGGVTARPRPEELTAMKQPHVQPTSEQLSHQQAAASDKGQFASANGGHPTQAAVATPNRAPANTGGGRNPSNPNGQGNSNKAPGNNANGQQNGNKAANNTPGQQKPQQQQQRQQRQPKNNNNNNKKNKKN